MPEIYLGRNLFGLLSPLAQRHMRGPLCLVADANTAVLAARARECLNRGANGRLGLVAAELIHPGHLDADEANVAAVMAAAGDAGGLVAVGSGCITDVTRLAAYRLGIPYIVMATAASMDGYLSGHAPIIQGGYKITIPAQPPRAVVADLDVLEAAPLRLTRAGVGDVLGKYTALADWRLGHIMTGEPWCGAISDSVRRAVEECRVLAPRLGSGESPGGENSPARAAIEALFVTGRAMVCVGNSRPASGAEHHIAHYWEMQALARGETPHLHGEHVAAACTLVCALYERMMDQDRLIATTAEWTERVAQLCDRAARNRRLAIGFGAAAARAADETAGKDARLLGSLSYPELCARWDESRRVLAGNVPKAAEVVAALRAAGMAGTPAELGLSAQDVQRGLLYARELRNRFTILDAAAAAGRLTALAAEIAQEAATW